MKQVPMERMDELFAGKWYTGWKARVDLLDDTENIGGKIDMIDSGSPNASDIVKSRYEHK